MNTARYTSKTSRTPRIPEYSIDKEKGKIQLMRIGFVCTYGSSRHAAKSTLRHVLFLLHQDTFKSTPGELGFHINPNHPWLGDKRETID
jgi:hypothetical protein